MKARYFIAPAVLNNGLNTWKKLFVLTEDNVLYCEYLEFKEPAKVIKQFDFQSFKASHYSWGRGEFQHMFETDYESIINEKLSCQKNWIDSYLEAKTKN